MSHVIFAPCKWGITSLTCLVSSKCLYTMFITFLWFTLRYLHYSKCIRFKLTELKDDNDLVQLTYSWEIRMRHLPTWLLEFAYAEPRSEGWRYTRWLSRYITCFPSEKSTKCYSIGTKQISTNISYTQYSQHIINHEIYLFNLLSWWITIID